MVGRMNVRKLYPSGRGAPQIMRLIHAREHGGPGRLEGRRTDLLGKDGAPVPVLISAALIMERGEPVGSVGVFTDLRERLRMETRLEEAQEELRAREKQSIIAELAGAAAHELNQPLTSVLGYAELIRRRSSDAEGVQGSASIILQEAERMADIVRKVGKITRYETKNYVGAAKILDLDRSSGARAPFLRTATAGTAVVASETALGGVETSQARSQDGHPREPCSHRERRMAAEGVKNQPSPSDAPSAPSTERVSVVQHLPAAWLDRLLVVECQLRADTPFEEAATQILGVARELCPDAALGVCVPRAALPPPPKAAFDALRRGVLRIAASTPPFGMGAIRRVAPQVFPSIPPQGRPAARGAGA